MKKHDLWEFFGIILTDDDFGDYRDLIWCKDTDGIY